MTPSTFIYRTAARVLSPAFLNLPFVRSVFIRRSVAAGEASFPWSDLDLAIVIQDASGPELLQLRRRFRAMRCAFPRLGECQVFTPEDLLELAATDPYRSSLDRRCGITVFGAPPVIPATPIPPPEAARRLVFWFESFIPRAIAQNNRRNLRKFSLEIANALGVLEGRWPEPLLTRRETAERAGVPADPLGSCYALAARAHRLLRPAAPQLAAPLELPGLVVTSEPLAHLRPGLRVLTPEIVDLLLQTQNPDLWTAHGSALAAAGFDPPSPESWLRAARRWAAGERIRGPGFLEPSTAPAVARLHASARILGLAAPAVPENLTVAGYYRHHYETLSTHAAALRAQATA